MNFIKHIWYKLLELEHESKEMDRCIESCWYCKYYSAHLCAINGKAYPKYFRCINYVLDIQGLIESGNYKHSNKYRHVNIT